MSAATPEAVIGLELDGKGLASANAELDRHAQGWEKIDRLTGRIGANVEGMFGRIATIGGAVGLGALINDFVKLDAIASRAALSVNVATGRSGFTPYAGALRSAGIATSTNPAALGSALTGLQTAVGGSYLKGPAQWNTLGRELGYFSRAYGVDVGALGSALTTLEQTQKVGPGATREILAAIASQAARTGQAGQTSQWLAAVTAATGYLGQSHVAGTAMGASRTMGALYGAVTSANPSFKDPSLFAAGVAGVDSAITGAYANPRLQAALQMAGVSYWDQRAGLGGKHGAQTAKKVLRWSQQMYGKGTVEQDLFLRSAFGDVSADMLKAFGNGQVTYDQLLKKTDPATAARETQRRAHSDQDTAAAGLEKKRAEAGKDASGIFGKLFGALGHLSVEDLVALGIGGKVASKLGRRALGKGLGRMGERGAAKALEDGAAEEELAKRARRILGDGWRSGMPTSELGAVGGAVERKAAAMMALKIGGKLLGKAGPVGAIIGFGMDADNAGWSQHDEARHLAQAGWNDLSQRFGAGWWNNKKAIDYARKHGMIDVVGKDPNKSDWWLRSAIQQARSDDHRPKHTRSEDLFIGAIDKFAKKVDELTRAQGPGRKGASWDGGDGGGGLNAAGARTGNDTYGSNMILARMVSPAGSASSGAVPASYGDPGGSGGGSGGGGGATGSGGWKACTITWYDPGLGGTNSSHGQKDPHAAMANGRPFQRSAHTCAAPPRFAFGTLITFRSGAKRVTCEVTDRGGAIQGDHFDLTPSAWQALGKPSTASFKVAGRRTSGNGQSPRAKAASAGGGSSGGAAVATAASAGADAAWVASGSPSLGGGGGGGPAVHVHVDGREIHKVKRLTRG